jgi:hypothetical protein
MPHGIPSPGPWDLPGDIATLNNEGYAHSRHTCPTCPPRAYLTNKVTCRYAEGEDVWVRLATIVRVRRLDLRLLMDAEDKHNRGFVDIHSFQKSLAYALGEQWNELAVTTEEFKWARVFSHSPSRLAPKLKLTFTP